MEETPNHISPSSLLSNPNVCSGIDSPSHTDEGDHTVIHLERDGIDGSVEDSAVNESEKERLLIVRMNEWNEGRR